MPIVPMILWTAVCQIAQSLHLQHKALILPSSFLTDAPTLNKDPFSRKESSNCNLLLYLTLHICVKKKKRKVRILEYPCRHEEMEKERNKLGCLLGNVHHDNHFMQSPKIYFQNSRFGLTMPTFDLKLSNCQKQVRNFMNSVGK